MSSATTSPLTDFWQGLPEELKAKLRLGFTGKQHLLDVAGWCLRSGDPALVPVAVDAIQVAFGENPLDGEMARELLSHDVIRSILPQPTLDALNAVNDGWLRPGNSEYFERLLARRDFGKIKHFIAQNVSKEPGNLFWRGQAFSFGLMDNDPEWARAQLDFQPSPALVPCMTAITMRLDALKGACHDAARLSQELHGAFGNAFPGMHAGLCQLQAGEPAAANFMLIDALVQAPWNINLLLRVHDLLAGWDVATESLRGSVAVLLYSWNKAVELDATLRSLFESDLTSASIFLLNNGSTDETADILESWQSRFDTLLGAGRFHVVSLPVNIGAPAARNWLMHLDAVTQHDFICYLDDDVELASDWLLRFGAAVHHYPDAGVWGARSWITRTRHSSRVRTAICL